MPYPGSGVRDVKRENIVSLLLSSELPGRAPSPRRAPSPILGRPEPAERSFWQQLVIIPELPEHKAMGGMHWVEVWDLITTIILCVMSFWLPFEAALFSDGEDLCPAVQYALTFYFTADMVLQFFIALPSPSGGLSADQWVRDPRSIASRYCARPLSKRGEAGWFWIDIVPLLPGWADVACVVTGQPSLAGRGKVIGLARMLRLVRMLRLARLQLFVARWHALLGFPYYLMDFLKCIAVTTVTCHWFACMWILLEGGVLRLRMQQGSRQTSWLSALIEAEGDPCTPDAADDPLCVYLLAMYWAAMTINPIGYGSILPQTTPEYLMCVITFVLSGYSWAFLVGEVAAIIGHLGRHKTLFKGQMDDMNELLRERGLPVDLQVRVRRYMHEARLVRLQGAQQQLLEPSISSGLLLEVAECSARNSNLLKDVYWAQEFSREARLGLLNAFEPVAYGPMEVVTERQLLLVIGRGLLAVNGHFLRRGGIWGLESILLESSHLLDPVQPRTLSYVIAMGLKRHNLVHLASMFPEVDKRLRQAQVRVAVRRAVVLASRHCRQHRGALVAVPTQRSFSNLLGGHPLDQPTEAVDPPPVEVLGHLGNAVSELEERLEQRDAEVEHEFARLHATLQEPEGEAEREVQGSAAPCSSFPRQTSAGSILGSPPRALRASLEALGRIGNWRPSSPS